MEREIIDLFYLIDIFNWNVEFLTSEENGKYRGKLRLGGNYFQSGTVSDSEELADYHILLEVYQRYFHTIFTYFSFDNINYVKQYNQLILSALFSKFVREVKTLKEVKLLQLVELFKISEEKLSKVEGTLQKVDKELYTLFHEGVTLLKELKSNTANINELADKEENTEEKEVEKPEYEVAENEVDKSIDLSSYTLNKIISLGKMSIIQKDYTSAKMYFEEAVKQNNSEGIVGLMMVAQEEKDKEKYKEYLEILVKNYKEESKAAGKKMFSKSKYKIGGDIFKTILRIYPEEYDWYNLSLAEFHIHRDNLKAAHDYINEVKSTPRELYILQGRLAYAEKRYHDALNFYRSVPEPSEKELKRIEKCLEHLSE